MITQIRKFDITTHSAQVTVSEVRRTLVVNVNVDLSLMLIRK